jgi:hypothetical protein
MQAWSARESRAATYPQSFRCDICFKSGAVPMQHVFQARSVANIYEQDITASAEPLTVIL